MLVLVAKSLSWQHEARSLPKSDDFREKLEDDKCNKYAGVQRNEYVACLFYCNCTRIFFTSATEIRFIPRMLLQEIVRYLANLSAQTGFVFKLHSAFWNQVKNKKAEKRAALSLGFKRTFRGNKHRRYFITFSLKCDENISFNGCHDSLLGRSFFFFF